MRGPVTRRASRDRSSSPTFRRAGPHREDTIDIDLGGATLRIVLDVKGVRLPRFVWRVGVPTHVTPADKPASRGRCGPTHQEVDLVMDLLDDQKVPLSLQWTDDANNPVPAPADASAAFSVDDTSVITLTDNGDGTAVAAATGQLGVANVHVDVTTAGQTLTGDLQLVVVVSAAERVNVVAGTPEHV